MEMFRQIHAIDFDFLIIINDFDVISGEGFTVVRIFFNFILGGTP